MLPAFHSCRFDIIFSSSPLSPLSSTSVASTNTSQCRNKNENDRFYVATQSTFYVFMAVFSPQYSGRREEGTSSCQKPRARYQIFTLPSLTSTPSPAPLPPPVASSSLLSPTLVASLSPACHCRRFQLLVFEPPRAISFLYSHGRFFPSK